MINLCFKIEFKIRSKFNCILKEFNCILLFQMNNISVLILIDFYLENQQFSVIIGTSLFFLKKMVFNKKLIGAKFFFFFFFLWKKGF